METQSQMVAARLTAECPYCGAILEIIIGSYVDTRHGGCPHVVEISRIEGQIYVEYQCQQRNSSSPCLDSSCSRSR